jgi:heat-inducible transcriptional repressor
MLVQELSRRNREILRALVDTYVETGQPVGSRMLSRRLESRLSPASIRNVMADLEEEGLLYAPHTSAGRLPTEAGLRLFVDGLLEIGDLTEEERQSIEGRCASAGRSVQDVMAEATTALSGLSGCASIVLAPKYDAPVRQIEFVGLSPGQVLVVMVAESGMVENRLIEAPLDMTPSALAEAGRFLSARAHGRAIGDVRDEILAELAAKRSEVDEIAQRVIKAGLATWGGDADRSTLIVRGQAKLLEDVSAIEDLERVRQLFDDLEHKQDLLRLLDSTQGGEGVRIFIGAENKLFAQAGCAMVVAPLQNSRQKLIGAIGVIGPKRLNYARVIPMVDFTAQVIGRVIG